MSPSSPATPRPIVAPAGYKGPRGEILVELKRAHELTATDLAGKLGITLNAIRHHLKELEAEALIEFRRVRHGVGAPVFVYRLSAVGESLFPRRYEAALLDLLERLVSRDGREGAVSMLEARFDGLARELRPRLAEASPAERAEIVARALIDEGYMAEWEGSEGEGTLTEHNCAIRAVAERFPEVCAAEARFFADVLGASVTRQAHILAGCNACEYAVRFSETAPQSEAGRGQGAEGMSQGEESSSHEDLLPAPGPQPRREAARLAISD